MSASSKNLTKVTTFLAFFASPRVMFYLCATFKALLLCSLLTAEFNYGKREKQDISAV